MGESSQVATKISGENRKTLYQYSLKTLFLATTTVAVVLGLGKVFLLAIAIVVIGFMVVGMLLADALPVLIFLSPVAVVGAIIGFVVTKVITKLDDALSTDDSGRED